MKVDSSNLVSNSVQNAQTTSTQKLDKSGKAARTGRSGEAAAVTSDASAEISSKAREMSLANEVASSAPDVRADKIAELKKRIANKEYNINPDKIADRLVDEHLETSNLG